MNNAITETTPPDKTAIGRTTKDVIAELYPELTAAQQEESEYFLTRYLDLIRRIYERVERETKNRHRARRENSNIGDNV